MKYRRVIGLVPCISLFLILLSGLGLASASAPSQTTSDQPDPTWADAPSVPPNRSEAEWLVSMGWRPWDELFGSYKKSLCVPGRTEVFNLIGDTISATVRAVSEHGCFWVEDGVEFDADGLQRAAGRFDEIYALEHDVFGSEWLPGIDGDRRVHLLHVSTLGDAVGMFDDSNECPASVCPDSNEHEMIYIAMDWGPMGSDQHLTTIAHELQHLIQWNMDGNEFRWVDEGLSQLAEHVNGFPIEYITGDDAYTYLRRPDYNLIDWPFESEDTSIAYGSAFLFATYLYDRFGRDFVRALSECQADGMAGVDETLREFGISEDVDEVFADWTLANALNNPSLDDGRYAYLSLELPTRPYMEQMNVGMMYRREDVIQYGVDYYRVTGPGNYRLIFEGTSVAELAPVSPPSGRWVWWSYWSDSGAARLTGQFDLSGLDSATLEFSMWYDIESGYDILYVEASRDGVRWDILRGEHATDSGYASRGPGYTGGQTGWIRERVDLSEYVGGPVWIRFEYLTDGSITRTGFLLDDISIPQIGFYDDVESGAGVWEPWGFMRTPTTYSQRWVISVATLGPSPRVERYYVDGDEAAELPLTVGEDGAVVAISAITPFVRGRASYRYMLTAGTE